MDREETGTQRERGVEIVENAAHVPTSLRTGKGGGEELGPKLSKQLGKRKIQSPVGWAEWTTKK